MTYYIYALYAPDTNQAFYVGQSRALPQRLRAHYCEGRQLYRNCMRRWGEWSFGRNSKASWIGSLVAKGMRPQVHILDTAERRREARAIEAHWIVTLLWAGQPLQNNLRGQVCWKDARDLARAGLVNPRRI